MTVLAPHVSYDPDESLHSFLARLAAVHTGMGPKRLLTDIGVRKDSLYRGDPDALGRFATATGVGIDELCKALIIVRLQDVKFRGEQASKDTLSPRMDRVCLECLKQDGRPADRKHRLLWCFRDVTCCASHGCPLVTVDNAEADGLPFTSFQPNRRSMTEPAAMPSFVTFIVGRLCGQLENPSWMAEQSIEQVLTASRMIGATLEHGHRVRVNRLDAVERERAVERGFRILAAGRDAVVETLDEIRNASSATAVQAGPLAMYGQLYDWLDRRANMIDPGPIRDVLRDHIVQHSAVDVGQIILGVEITRRKFHSIGTLSAQIGMDRRRLSRLLQKLGHVPTGAPDAESGRLVFPAEAMETFCSDLANAVLLQDVPEFLGASKGQVRSLYGAGLLQPLVPVEEAGAVRKVVFSRRHLDAFLARIDDLPICDPETSESTAVPISEAVLRNAGTTVGFVSRILGDGITSGMSRRSGKVGLNAVMVRSGPGGKGSAIA